MMIPANRHAVNRIVETMDKAQMTFARYGKRAWEAAYMQKTKRSKPTLVNEVWFGDHHKLDLVVLDENDNLVRPWMTAWMDACSKKIVGWELTYYIGEIPFWLNAVYVAAGEAAVLLVLGTALYFALGSRRLQERLFPQGV